MTPPSAPQHAKRTPNDSVDSQEQKKKPRRGGRRGKGGNGGKDAKPSGAGAPGAPKAAKALETEPVDVLMEDATGAKSLAHLSETTFASLAISDKTKRAIVEELKYEFLTNVQNETIAPILEGKDVLAKAKTGNGKTIAFLLPVIENLTRVGRVRDSIPALVISPTRELALQIATEARRLTSFHSLQIACFVGGSSINRDVKSLTSSTPLDILIATPGRLLDHIGQDTGSINKKLGNAKVLVLDEADRLLDMGFRQEIMKILRCLPEERQTLLFSATLPASTEELKKVALRSDYVFVDTIEEDDHQTNAQTVQEYMVCSMQDNIAVVEHVLRQHIAARAQDYKVMVFFPTARAAQFMAQLFTAAGFKDVLEMHSRKSQSARTKAADAFRGGKRVMMFSSDVSARGVDYPDVSLVLQVGLTDRDQYIHRLGRTARAGSDGHGVLVLSEFEKPLLKELKDLPLQEVAVPADMDASATDKVTASLKRNSELEKSAQQSYQAWLGFYNSNLKRLGLQRERLVQLAADYSSFIGLSEVPKLEKKTLKKMNLFGVAGLVPAPFEDRRPANGNGGNNPRNNGNGGGNGGGNRNNGKRPQQQRR
ncbi:hypothetical protein Poli38472_000602 [Pythium oligandrum]|uniref:ATP-dependent RNA helicase n=1 Tax=Pythium oligandrum TaxID=41045 RepID=A0A8K1CD13_PYTOL|nr:hypothetical protein Poli38472_000602 [Pythium oligandrum]|eukprot:TMW60560.1 hypothetical protein Poli38472_000602 [Pythium oligandrum]